MAFTGAAASVVAQQFILIDPNGVIVGNFGTAPGTQFLTFLHNDTLTTDSVITWTNPTLTAPGIEYVELAGPKAVAEPGGTTPPSLRLSDINGVHNAQLYGASEIDLTTSEPSGVLNSTQIIVTSRNNPTFGVNGDIRLLNDRVLMQSISGADRGIVYGDKFEQKAGVLTNVLNTGNTLATLAAVTYPVAGFIEIIATVSVVINIINDALTYSIVIDGAVVRTAVWQPGVTGINTRWQFTISHKTAVAAGAHTVRLDVSDVTNNAYATDVNSNISATYHM